MTLVKNDLTFADGERDLLMRYVFFENGNEPASRTGEGAPQGVIRLTNKRFFYISIKKEYSTLPTKGLKIATNLTTSILDNFTFGLVSITADLTEYGIKKSLESLDNEQMSDLMGNLANEESFVIPVSQIVYCQRIEEEKNHFVKPKKYIRLGIRMDDRLVYEFCIYNMDKRTYMIVDQSLYEEISVLGKEISCESCGEVNSLRSRFCISCGSAIKKLCESCGEVNSLRSRFCISCGSAIKKLCESCGEVNSLRSRFCISCGSAINMRIPPILNSVYLE